MAGSPRPLARPVAVLGGWRSPPFMARALARRLAALTSRSLGDFRAISFPFASSIGRAASIARHAIEEHLDRWHGPASTREIDIVAISMGGLVARILASTPSADDQGPSLHVRRIFTISTPHRGALLARWIRPDSAARDMQPSSDFLRTLDLALAEDDASHHPAPHLAPPELISYAQRLDWWVGTWNTAPRGHPLRCAKVRGPVSAVLSHFTAHSNPAIVLDIARHLRGEGGGPSGSANPG